MSTIKKFQGKKGILLLLLLLACGACDYATDYPFRPVPSSTTWRVRTSPSVRHEVQVPGEKSVWVYLSCGASRHDKKGQSEQKVTLKFTVHNRSNQEFGFFPTESLLTDDEGRKFEKPVVTQKKDAVEAVAVSLKVPAAAKIKGQAVFSLPADLTLEGMGSLRYEWAYSLQDKRETVSTKFLQVERNGGVYYPHYHGGLYYRRWYCW